MKAMGRGWAVCSSRPVAAMAQPSPSQLVAEQEMHCLPCGGVTSAALPLHLSSKTLGPHSSARPHSDWLAPVCQQGRPC